MQFLSEKSLNLWFVWCQTCSRVSTDLGCPLVRGTQCSEAFGSCQAVGAGPFCERGADRWKIIAFPNFPFRGLKCSSGRDPLHIQTGGTAEAGNICLLWTAQPEGPTTRVLQPTDPAISLALFLPSLYLCKLFASKQGSRPASNQLCGCA